MTKPAIYDLHDKAFNRVSAYVIMAEKPTGIINKVQLERVATIAFKFPADGAGRLYAYVHWLGVEMVRGHANGYGYDKKSAAVESAIAKLLKQYEGTTQEVDLSRIAFIKSLKDIGGATWDSALRDAGFTVLQAV